MDTSVGQSCCFRACEAAGPAALALEVHPPPDAEPVKIWAHETCFDQLRHASVEHDDPKHHGRIPPKARCAFCGEPLPIIGLHPFVFDVGAFTPPHRFWAHSNCMLECVVPTVAEQLTDAGQSPD